MSNERVFLERADAIGTIAHVGLEEGIGVELRRLGH